MVASIVSAEPVIGINDAGAGQRQMLPGPGIARLIGRETGQRRRKRAGIAGWPQPHVGLVEHAGRRRRRQGGDEALGQAGEIMRGRERLLAVGLLDIRAAPNTAG